MIQITKRPRSQNLLFYSEDLRKGVEPLRLVSISFTVTKKNDLTGQGYTSLQMSLTQSSLRVFRVLVEG